MSCPAYEQLGKDIRLGYASWRCYMRLAIGSEHEPPILNFVTPVEVKVWYLAQTIPLSPRKVRSSLDWLVRMGYLVEHGRDARGVRSLSLAFSASPPTRFAA